MADKNQFTDLQTVLGKYFYRWPLFVLFLILTLSGAYYYLQVVNPAYEISAAILVKDQKKLPDEKSALPELDQSNSPKSAEAEIEILRSKKLISQVIDTLQLWTTYKTRNGLKVSDLYETSPVKFILLKKTGVLTSQKLNVFIKDKNTYEVENLSGNKELVKFGADRTSGFGEWTLQPTEFINQYIGSTIAIGLQEPESTSNDYVKYLDAHLLDKLAPTIGLFVSDEVPKRGKDFLNHLIRAYNEAAAADEKRNTRNMIEFIDKRLASLTGELSSAEKNVEGYRSSQGLTDISSQSKVYLENVQANDAKLNDVNVQLNIIDGIERYINSPSAQSAPSTIGITDPSLNNLIGKLSELQLKRSALLATTPEGNPMFEPINRQISLAKSSIRETVNNIKSSLLNSKRGLQSFNNKTESSIRQLPGQERQFVDMKRQSSLKENLYVYLLQKREELALSYASNFSDARIVDQANIGDIKWPKKPLVFAIAMLLGIGLPFMMIYFRGSFNARITSRGEIESALDVPILGELSFEELNEDPIVVNNKANVIGEQFRSLRTNLNYLHETISEKHKEALLTSGYDDGIVHNDSRGRVTLLTSSISKEGKSFVSTNLAASLAASGKKTVVLEMDLRKPKVLAIFDLPSNHPGISEFLSGQAEISNIIQPSGKINHLDVIGSGKIPSDPSELLEGDKLITLITGLRERYDNVVIDTAPVHLVTDAMIIAKLADVNLYVIRQGYTGKDELTFMQNYAENNKLPNLNIVFNGITKAKYGYGYNYDNSYYAEAKKTTFKKGWKRFLSRF